MRAPFVVMLLGTVGFHMCNSSHCPVSSGNKRPRQQNGSYEFYDPDACNCTAWVPKAAPKARVGISPLDILRAPPPPGPKPKPLFGNCAQHHSIKGAPWGLTFFGMSMSQRHPDVPTSNQASVTHQTKFDLNRLQDRGNEYSCQTNDDGWLGGGGQGPSSFLLPNIDSTHMEFVHPVTICSSVSKNFAVQPDLSSYTAIGENPTLITGAPLSELIGRVRSNVAFDILRLIPTGADHGNDYTFRFNPWVSDYNETVVNPTMLAVWEKLVHEFYDVQVLDKSDPFHISMVRDMYFCNNETYSKFVERNEEKTIKPWIQWATEQKGIVLNDEIPRYQGKTGGFYLFITRNRPLIYFAPHQEGRHAKGSRAFYCQWEQDGKVVDFANPVGGPVTETLVEIPSDLEVSDFIKNHDVLQEMSEGLCNDYGGHAMPTTTWTPGQRSFQSVV